MSDLPAPTFTGTYDHDGRPRRGDEHAYPDAPACTPETAASLRDELIVALAEGVVFDMKAVALSLEQIAATMRASLRPDQRPGADVIPFPARVAIPVQSLESN